MFDITLESISLLTYFIVFVSGVIICFTPCIYPILPVIVGYIGGSEIKTKREGFIRSLSYVLVWEQWLLLAGLYSVLFRITSG